MFLFYLHWTLNNPDFSDAPNFKRNLLHCGCVYILLIHVYSFILPRHTVAVQLGRFAKVLDLFDEALEPSLRVAFDGTNSTPCLDARRLFF